MEKDNRRDFLRTVSRIASATSVGIAAGSYSRILGANETVNLGVIGLGDRGTHDMELFVRNPGVQVRAVCDVFGQKVDAAKQKVPNAETFSDYRKLLESKNLDAVLIATPDHWH